MSKITFTEEHKKDQGYQLLCDYMISLDEHFTANFFITYNISECTNGEDTYIVQINYKGFRITKSLTMKRHEELKAKLFIKMVNKTIKILKSNVQD